MREGLFEAFLVAVFFVAAGYGALYYAHTGLSEAIVPSIFNRITWGLAIACMSALTGSIWCAALNRHAWAAILAVVPVPLAIGASDLAGLLSK
jgi:hypothetical protein